MKSHVKDVYFWKKCCFHVDIIIPSIVTKQMINKVVYCGKLEAVNSHVTGNIVFVDQVLILNVNKQYAEIRERKLDLDKKSKRN